MNELRPNIVVMHCHDLGRFLGSYGYPTVRTPHLDAFAADGVRFSQAFAAAPQCSPSRAALFTGRWPHANGVLGLTHGSFAWNLQADEEHLGSRLQGRGYSTAMVGVHHESLAQPDSALATRLGFDHVDTSEVLAAPVADRAVGQLDLLASGARPFYLQVGFLEPHRIPGSRDPDGTMGFIGNHLEPDDANGVTIPAYLRDTPSSRAELAELQGAVRHMDIAAGRVLEHLERLGVADNTLVMFTTDHGLALPRAKCSLYDPGLEVALIVRYPQRGWSGGRIQDALVSNVDIVPTLLDLLDSRDTTLHGRSLLGLLDGAADPGRQEIFGEITYHDYYDPRRCVRTGAHKLIANFSSAYGFMDPSGSWNRRCIPKVPTAGATAYHPPIELYDLRDDPYELTNVAAQPEHAAIVADLARRLLSWMQETRDPLLNGAVTSPMHTRTVGILNAQGPSRAFD
ncbi:sulfatase [Kribbella pittospori]|uniref:Sulfatase n=1 Tax=Kribbella pittospori TaxID=722689 RepID=A0A4R0JVF2_9ACTN|nr:sulfatase [Kribbella pittospori]TCC51483.1 sulfatase [Kribbella pittospori]